ncbi:MAG: hypothetical protein ACI86H_001361 [bacterium]|jgi:hypothetical protein
MKFKTLIAATGLFLTVGVSTAFGVASCSNEQARYSHNQALQDELSGTALANKTMNFFAIADNEEKAKKEAKKRIAASILNIVKVQSSTEQSTTGNLKQVQTKLRQFSKVDEANLLDVPLSQPIIKKCLEGTKTRTIVVYTFKYKDLAAPSLSYIRNFRSQYKRYIRNRGNVDGFSALLEAYKSRVKVANRPGYFNGALKIAKINKKRFLTLKQVEAKLRRMVSDLRVRSSSRSIRLKPTDNLKQYNLIKPQEITVGFGYRRRKVPNLPLLITIETIDPSQEAFTTDQNGSIKIASLKLRIDGAVKINLAEYANAKERQAALSKYCPKKVTIGIDIGKSALIDDIKPIQLKSFPTSCNTLASIAFEKAQKEKTFDSYANFIKEFPESTEKQQAERLLFALVKSVNTKAIASRYLETYPQSSNRREAVSILYKKVKEENTWSGYVDFIKKYSDSSEKVKVVKQLGSIAMTLPSNTLSEKEEKVDKLTFVKKYSAGSSNAGSIGKMVSELELAIKNEREKKLKNPVTEDAYVLELRSVHVPNRRVAVAGNMSNVTTTGAEFRSAEIGYGIGKKAGFLVGTKWDYKWKKPWREWYANGQVRIFGEIQDRFSIALGATYIARIGDGTDETDYELKDQEEENAITGVDKEGDSQFINDQSESEYYLTMAYKVPQWNTYFYLYAGSRNVRTAIQYFFVPKATFAIEAHYRHADYTFSERTYESTLSTTVQAQYIQDREDQADEQRSDVLLGFTIATPLLKDAAHTKLYYSLRRNQAILRIGLSF